jgi:hypothetical protein
MNNHSLIISILLLGVLWLKFRVKIIKPHHLFILLMFCLVNLKTFIPSLSLSKQMGSLLILSTLFGYYDIGNKRKMMDLWRYLIIPFGYGIYLIAI